MPKAAHRALNKSAKKKGLTGERKDAYVYGTLNKIENRTAKKAKRKAKKVSKQKRSGRGR